MSELKIRRRSRQVAVTLHTAVASCTELRLDDFAGGAIDLGTLSTSATTLQMWAASEAGGSYRRVRKVDGTAADVTLASSTAEGRVYALPDEVYAVPFLKVVAGEAAANGVPGIVTLKS